MVYTTAVMLKKGIESVLTVSGNDVRIADETRLRKTLIDDLIRTAVFRPGGQRRGPRPAG